MNLFEDDFIAWFHTIGVKHYESITKILNTPNPYQAFRALSTSLQFGVFQEFFESRGIKIYVTPAGKSGWYGRTEDFWPNSENYQSTGGKGYECIESAMKWAIDNGIYIHKCRTRDEISK